MTRSDSVTIGAPLNSGPLPSLQWIEVSSSLQIPSFHIIGLPAPEVAEARERVRSAIESSGLDFPRRRIVLNLSPASIRKQGTGLDLSMALAVLAASERSSIQDPSLRWVAWGELGLDGRVKSVGQITRALYSAWKERARALFLPLPDAEEAQRLIPWISLCGDENLLGEPPEIIPVNDLSEAWSLFKSRTLGLHTLSSLPQTQDKILISSSGPSPLEETVTQPASLLPLPPALERIILASAVGQHHLLILGPKGTGKSHALEWRIALQAPADPLTRLRGKLLEELSLRAPSSHGALARRIGSQVRPAALIGSLGPGWVQPGEFTLAHGGLLIADELPEWPRDSREVLREPLERGAITLSRVGGSEELPADFVLAATGNLCPCGGWPPELPMSSQIPGKPGKGSKIPRCRCSLRGRTQYLHKLSGPILDRVDLVALHASTESEPCSNEKAPLSRVMKQAEQARMLLISRWGTLPGSLGAEAIERTLSENPQWAKESALNRGVSLRGRHKLFRVALTLAALDGCSEPERAHFAEARIYRAELFEPSPEE